MTEGLRGCSDFGFDFGIRVPFEFVVEGTGMVTVSNVLGQTILVREIDGQTSVALPSGMYFVRLGNVTQKVVVK